MKPTKKLTRIGKGILETETTFSPSVPGLVFVMESCANRREDWVRLIDERLLPLQPRLKSVLDPTERAWSTLPDGWSCDGVVTKVDLQGRDWADVELLISSLHSKPLEVATANPLWRLFVIEGFEDKQVVFW